MKAEEMAKRLEGAVTRLAQYGGGPSLIEWDEISNRILSSAALLRSQAEEIERLREALKPFSDMVLPQSEFQRSYPDTMAMLQPFPYAGAVITLGHFRHARAAMEAKHG